MDGLKVLFPPPPADGGTEEDDNDAAVARRLHGALNARPARRGRVRPREEAAEERGLQAAVEEEEEEEEVKIRLLEMAVKAEPEEVKIRAVQWGGEGGKRRRVKREVVAAETGPSGRFVRGDSRSWGAGGQQVGTTGRETSRFRGVTQMKGGKAKPWLAKIGVTEDGKHRTIHIAHFAREEDAARTYDRVNIAKLGHAKAKTNFPVADYRAEWAELEALGVGAAAARERQRARED